MKNTKAILPGAVMAPMLALTGGIAYASTATPGHPAPPRAAITATAQHPVGQARLGWCDWRYTGYWGDWHRYGHQTTHQRGHHAAYRHHNYRHHYGYQHRGDYRTWSGQGYGYQGGWGSGSGSHWGNGGGCCGHSW